MHPIFDPLLDHSGVAGRRQLALVATQNQIDAEIRRGDLVRIAPQAYSRPWNADTDAAAEAAALMSTSGACALSHTTALRRWDLPSLTGGPIHLTAASDERPRPRPGVFVHRTRLSIEAEEVDGAATVLPSWAIVGSWALLTGSQRRAPLIAAVARRIVTPDTVRAVVARHTRLRGRAALVSLLELVESGCQSELELWGYTRVFDVPGLRHAIRQRTIVVDGRSYRLDMAYEFERVAVELDGRAYHASTDQWDRDIARDLALATTGWQTIRLSHRRLTTDIEGCRRDVLRVLESRRSRR